MQEKSALGRAMAMVRDLRERCPWDREQTRETLRPYLVEEAHELDQAIASGDPAAIRDEVADLLLHLAWQLVLAEELGQVTTAARAGDPRRGGRPAAAPRRAAGARGGARRVHRRRGGERSRSQEEAPPPASELAE